MSWTGDSSGTMKVEGSKVTFAGGKDKGNAMWSQAGTGYWEFKVGGKSGAWVGVSSDDKFGEGWAIKGLFYGGPGNLSDGGSLVTGSWGPSFGEGDTIGMRVEAAGDTTTVAFSKNGTGLGTAFNIEGWSGGSGLRAAVSLSKADQSVTITQGSLPALSAMQAASGQPVTAVEGSWSGRFSLHIEKEGEGWRVSAQVGNSMSCSVSKQDDGTLVAGAIMATMMMPPPHLQALEREVTKILETLKSWSVQNNKLVLKHAAGEEELSPDSGPGPAHKQNVNWLN